MRQWEETKRDEGALLRGVPLTEAEEKLKERREELSPLEQNFIQQSIELRERLRREEKDRGRRGIAVVSVAALLIITALGMTGWDRWQQAKSNAKQAKINSDKANYNALALVNAEQGLNKYALYYLNQALQLDPKDDHTYYSLGTVKRTIRDNRGAL